MLIDLIIVIIILIFCFFGYKNGIVYTLIHTFGWLLSLGFAILFAGSFGDILEKHTALYDKLYDAAADLVNTSVGETLNTFLSKLPDILQVSARDAADDAVQSATAKIADAALAFISFVGLLIIIKLLLFVIAFLLSKRYRGGFVGGFDGFLGAILGIVQAAFVVFILLAISHPLALLISTDSEGWLTQSLSRSIFSGFLESHNPIIMLINGYTSDMLSLEYWKEEISKALPEIPKVDELFKNN